MHNLKSKKRLTIGISVLVLYALFLTALFYSPTSKNNKVLTTDQQIRTESFIANTTPSQQSQVEKKIVAEKTNLKRKLIKPQNPQNTSQITSIIQNQGGNVIETTPDFVVAEFPKENEQQINAELQETQSAQSIEVDYPTFLTADAPDWGVERIQAPDVWDTTTANGISIAVIDTGIDYNHSDLSQRYGGGYDVYNNDTDPYDDHGHGTHVSGIIASSLNEFGIAGVAPGVQVVAVKALGSDGTGYISDVIEAVDWAMRNNTQVINFSLGTTYNSSQLENKLNEAAAQGITLVAAAGNTNGGSLLYPAAYGSVIAVSATDQNDNFASFSSVGAEIAAPGVSINSTVPNNGYATWSGTSMAAPHVAATAGLMIANNQSNIRKNLRDTAVDLGSTGNDAYYGYGLVHAKPAALGEDTQEPLITFLSPENNSYVNGTVLVNIDVQDESDIENANLRINNSEVAEWTQEPYEYSWDTAELSGEYTIVASATDEEKNSGEAKITVTVSDNIPTPTPTQHQMQKQGESAEVRQDTNQEQAESNRRDRENAPNSPEDAQQKNESASQKKDDKIPEVSNINQRNQKPEKSQGANKSQNRGNSVRGISTELSIWERLIQNVKKTFNL